MYGYVVQEKEFIDGDLSSVAAVIGKKSLTKQAPWHLLVAIGGISHTY